MHNSVRIERTKQAESVREAAEQAASERASGRAVERGAELSETQMADILAAAKRATKVSAAAARLDRAKVVARGKTDAHPVPLTNELCKALVMKLTKAELEYYLDRIIDRVYRNDGVVRGALSDHIDAQEAEIKRLREIDLASARAYHHAQHDHVSAFNDCEWVTCMEAREELGREGRG